MRNKERENGKVTEGDPPSTNSFTLRTQQLGLGQAETWSENLSLPRG